MEPDFWHARWREHQIGFHQASVSPLLAKHHAQLGAPEGSRVLVPLCGKSLDLRWLAAQGRAVVGVELSPIAVDELFAEQKLSPEVDTHGPFTRKRAAGIELLCGDIFHLTPELLGPVSALFDRAALVALPEPLRSRYAKLIAALLPAGARGLLVSFAYQPEVGGPPFSVDEATVRALWESAFSITALEHVDILDAEPRFKERGITSLHESAYALVRKPR
jgi:thiopurine S-methyltransferase